MNDNNENINDFLARFYDASQVPEIAEDIRRGDQLIASFPAPKPDPAAIKAVKAKITTEISRRKNTRFSKISYRGALVAVLAVLAFAGIRTIVHQGTAPDLSTERELSFFWGDAASAATLDPRLALLNDQLDEIENTIASIAVEETENDSVIAIDDLEMEIMEISVSIWKG